MIGKQINEIDTMMEHVKEFKTLIDNIMSDGRLNPKGKHTCIRICECLLDEYDY